ncbi:acetyl esterase/lipase [Sphingomonas sp. BE138]|uniref:alpha/beta hydrolase n=1 Tax=Sphingomonas sp. BE138 TaxID=2817845 RepID=UPI00285DA948|nr:alpha/beta hydrolase [Sphingomonas sp. BE138]MDR6788294.1 acetyl esterase/lipase [Sphingomonas sp. BE138]
MMQPTGERDAIAVWGDTLKPSALAGVRDLFRQEQERLAAAQPAAATDLAYGPDARHRLDVYRSDDGGEHPRPVLLWVHGGGFLRGEKASPEHPYNAHAGRWAARHGMVGAVMNYRLAPDHVWPAGGEDVGAALDWLAAHVATFGGDPQRIVVVGTSAGAAHIATHLHLRNGTSPAAGAVLLSGLYGFAPLEERDRLYFGTSVHDADRSDAVAMTATKLPLLLACAQYDPQRFQAETIGLVAARFARHGRLPRSFYGSGHNHFSLAYHLGTSDTRLADEILAFIGDLS